MYPNDFVFFTLLGILWELIEFTLSKTLRDGGQSVMRDKNNELEYNKMMDPDAINYDPNYKIYFGLIFTDGYGIFEDSENVNKINSYCESFNREENILNCDKKEIGRAHV